jgi:hypothetical protein
MTNEWFKSWSVVNEERKVNYNANQTVEESGRWRKTAVDMFFFALRSVVSPTVKRFRRFERQKQSRTMGDDKQQIMEKQKRINERKSKTIYNLVCLVRKVEGK